MSDPKTLTEEEVEQIRVLLKEHQATLQQEMADGELPTRWEKDAHGIWRGFKP